MKYVLILTKIDVHKYTHTHTPIDVLWIKCKAILQPPKIVGFGLKKVYATILICSVEFTNYFMVNSISCDGCRMI